MGRGGPGNRSMWMALQSLGSGQAGLFSVFSLVSSLEAVLLSICRHTVLTCVVPPRPALWWAVGGAAALH